MAHRFVKVYTGQTFCRMFLDLGLCYVSSLLGLGYAFFARAVLEVMLYSFSLHPVKLHVLLICPLIGGVDFYHLIKMESAKFLHSEVSLP